MTRLAWTTPTRYLCLRRLGRRWDKFSGVGLGLRWLGALGWSEGVGRNNDGGKGEGDGVFRIYGHNYSQRRLGRSMTMASWLIPTYFFPFEFFLVLFFLKYPFKWGENPVFTSLLQQICKVLQMNSECNQHEYRGGEKRTIIASNKCVPITICYCSIYILLCFLKCDIHKSVKAWENS